MTDQPKDFYKLIVVLSFLIVGSQSFTLALPKEYVDQVAQESLGSPETIIYIEKAADSTSKPSISTTGSFETSKSFPKDVSATTIAQSETYTTTIEESESTETIPEISTPKSENKVELNKLDSNSATFHS